MYLRVSTNIFLTIIILVKANPNVNPEDLSNPYYLNKLAWEEVTFVSNLVKLMEKWDSDGTILATKYLKVFREDTKNFPAFQGHGGSWSSKVSAIVTNPNSVYQLARRYFLHMNALRDWAQGRGNVNVLHEIPIKSQFPEYQVRDAIRGIIRLCRFYDLPAPEVARGQFLDIKTGIGLHSCQCNEIGLLALVMENYVVSISFLQTALDLSTYDGSCNPKAIRVALDSAIEKHDVAWKSKVRNNAAIAKFIFNRLVAPVRQRYKDNFLPILVPMFVAINIKCPAPSFPNCIQRQGDGSKIYFKHVSKEVCLGRYKPVARERQKMICWQDRKTNPLWRINPLRMEIVSWMDPELILVHNFLGSQTIAKLEKVMLGNGMRVNRPVNETDDRTMLYRDYYQCAVKGFSSGVGFPEYNKIASLMEVIIDRRWAGAHEKFQSIAYSPGGHYYKHDDKLKAPELGGITGFPTAGVGIRPVAGAATFWVNTDPDNGHKNFPHATHEGCPVILGKKLVVKRMSETKPMEHRNPTK